MNKDERHPEQKAPLRTDHIINPYRTDFIYKLLGRKLAREKPLFAGLIYFLVSYAGVYILGALTGQLHGKNGLGPMYTQIVDNINLAFLAPVGAGLLCHLYNTIQRSLKAIRNEGIIESQDLENFDIVVSKMEKAYNSRYAFAFFLAFSVAINLFTYFTKTGSWLGVNGGITGAYGRLLVIVNYFIIGFILYKSLITIWGLQKILEYNIDVQPMHPDGAGGLGPIGDLSAALSYFAALIVMFISILIVCDPAASGNVVFVAIICVLYVIAPFIPFLSLSKANKKMQMKKTAVLNALNVTFQDQYRRLTKTVNGSGYDIDNADEILAVNELYHIVEAMPVWPFDLKTLRRVVSSIVVPLVIFIINQINTDDSILNQILAKIQDGLGFTQ